MMQIGACATDRYYTPYKTNANVKMISGFSLNAEGRLEVKEADESSEFKGFVGEFVDYQKFHKAWMSQGETMTEPDMWDSELNREDSSKKEWKNIPLGPFWRAEWLLTDRESRVRQGGDRI